MSMLVWVLIAGAFVAVTLWVCECCEFSIDLDGGQR